MDLEASLLLEDTLRCFKGCFFVFISFMRFIAPSEIKSSDPGHNLVRFGFSVLGVV